MTFLDELQKQTNKTATTTNGAVTNNSTLDAHLDFFSMAGAMRNNLNSAVRIFEKAYLVDKEKALRILFYLRDVRGGQGERSIFRACLQRLEKIDPNTVVDIVANDLIGEYGRYDDLFVLSDSNVISAIELFIKSKLESDIKNMESGKSISLLAKWLPSENASSGESRGRARALAKSLGIKPSKYRKTLSKLRGHLSLLEHKMSGRQWADIEYSNIPSQAGRKHTKAFKRHDEERYSNFLKSATKGEVKINTGTLYTYEIYDMARSNPEAANAMWASLDDYTNGEDALVVADVSGSMYGRPMSVSVSLALYFAERNKGIFKNKFMTFSQYPQLVGVVNGTLGQKMQFIERSDWGMTTDLEATFDVIKKAALSSGQGNEGMPKTLYIISDMQFNVATSNPSDTIFENAKKSFADAGLELPHVVFWNVDARDNNSPATMFDKNVTLISGSSQSTFAHAVNGKSPVELMLDIINSDRYNKIVV